MTHRRDLADYEVEHVVEAVLAAEQEGSDTVGDVAARSRVERPVAVVERVVARGLARLDGERIRLTPAGRDLAERQLRRHRLAELLFSAVLEVEDDLTVNRTACVMEHILSPAVTESVCSFLGHPKRCPHGKPIPPGPCCRTFSNAIEPLVQPLDALGVGESARIVYIVPKEADRLVRLAGLGMVPGVTLRLRQKAPAAVIAIGETTVALDPRIASEIYVKRVGEAGPA